MWAEQQKQLEQLRYKLQLLQLDLAWEEERQRYMGGKYHTLPPRPALIGNMIAAILIGVAMIYVALTYSLGIGLLILLMSVCLGIVSYYRLRSFEQAETRYYERRAQIVRDHHATSEHASMEIKEST